MSHPIPHSVPLLALIPDESDEPIIFNADEVLFPPRLNMLFSHDVTDTPALDALISWLYHINAYGHDITPRRTRNTSRACAAASRSSMRLARFGRGAHPCICMLSSSRIIKLGLALRRIAGAVARSATLKAKMLFLNAKMLFLNAKNDGNPAGYIAEDYITAIVRMLNVHYPLGSVGLSTASMMYPISVFAMHMVYLRNTRVAVDVLRVTIWVLVSLGDRALEIPFSRAR